MRRIEETPELAWVALAFILRAAFALFLDGRLVQIDEGAFDSVAWQLAATGAFGAPGTVLAPIPTFFYAATYLPGHYPVLARLAQAVVSTGTAWVLGRAVGQLTASPRAGRLALALAAVYPFFVYYSGLLLSETLYVAFVVPGLWLFCRSLGESGTPSWRAAAAGALLAGAALCRAEGAPLGAVLWLLAAVVCAAGRWTWKAWALAVLCWALPLAAWCARNKAAAGRFALDTHGGITMLHGTVLFDLNEIDTGVGAKALEDMEFYRAAQSLPEAERDKVYMKEAFAYMAADPARMLHQWARKFVNFWRFYPRTDKVYHQNTMSDPGVGAQRGLLVAVSLLFEPWLIPLGLAGLWRLRHRWDLFPLAFFLLGTMGGHMISVSQMRYRLPIMPILILGACWFLVSGVKLSFSPEGEKLNLTPDTKT